MLNILYLINHAGKAGTEKYVKNLVDAYHEDRANCFFAYNEEGLLYEQMKEKGIKCFRFDMKSPWDLKAAKTLAKICKENNIDIIHTQYPRENYIAILSKLFYNKPQVIYTCHLTLVTNFWWKISNSIITRFNKIIISVCNNGKDLLVQNGVNPNKITVIFNGLKVSETEVSPSTIRNELGIDDDTFVITTLARYHEAKGLPYLVRSIGKLKEIASRKFVCLIAGDGELFDEIKEQIKAAGLENEILQLGFRNDADNILNGSDIFVNSAKCYEALSFAILEALGKGLPVVATAVGGNGDIINPKHDCGFLVEYGSEEEMAKAIKTLMDDKEIYDKFSKNAVKAINEVFNLDIIVDKIFDEYVK